MLYKRTSETAREAVFSNTAGPSGPEGQAPIAAGHRAAEPSPEQIEIGRLREENASLRAGMDELRDAWESALGAAEARARDEAASRHVRDDAETLATLRSVLGEAQRAFAVQLDEKAGKLANALARDALSRLVIPGDQEEQWLVRTIARRLGELRASSVVELQLASSPGDEAVAKLREVLPPGTSIAHNASLRPSTARIRLRLGTVDIDPQRGMDALLRLFDEGDERG